RDANDAFLVATVFAPAALAGETAMATEATALAGPGEDLFVGTYSVSRNSSFKTGLWRSNVPHHVVQGKVSPAATYNKAITISIPRRLHSQLETTSRAARSLPNLRSHLAADVRELRGVLRKEGYSRSTVNRQMRELIRQNKALGGFGK